LTEKIKQKSRKFGELVESYLRSWENVKATKEKKRWVLLDDVLALLDNYVLIPVGKWQEIVEHIKNFPSRDGLPWGNARPEQVVEHRRILLEYEGKVYDWKKGLEAKVAELKEVSK